MHVHLQALTWGKDMVAMSGSGPDYAQTIIITPYMYSMIFHVPVMMRKHGSLRFFSGQGVCPFNVLSKHTNSSKHVWQKWVPKRESMFNSKFQMTNCILLRLPIREICLVNLMSEQFLFKDWFYILYICHCAILYNVYVK